MEQLIISCDWGTTSFRLRLVDRGSLLLKGEVLSDDGIGKLHNQWQNDNQLNRNSKEVFYLTYLFRQVEVLTKDITIPLSEIPIVISGMACSSIGMKELPYAVTPFYIDGSSAVIHKIEENIFQLNIFLISGVTNEIDVMRGEETQLVGLAQLELEMMTKDSICILPGTHSKHIKIQNGKIVDFKTFMTGELFDILNRHSILKVAVSGNSGIRSNLNQIDKEAFFSGVQQSQSGNLLNDLFSVRVNKLFERLSDEQNFFYLSGLLIGSELRSLMVYPDMQVLLCSSSNVYLLYHEAISELGLSQQTSFISPEIMNRAVVHGHVKLLNDNVCFFNNN